VSFWCKWCRAISTALIDNLAHEDAWKCEGCGNNVFLHHPVTSRARMQATAEQQLDTPVCDDLGNRLQPSLEEQVRRIEKHLVEVQDDHTGDACRRLWASEMRNELLLIEARARRAEARAYALESELAANQQRPEQPLSWLDFEEIVPPAA
jgi:hypothetical protein